MLTQKHLASEVMSPVLISTVPQATGHERMVAAFRDGDDLFIPLDSERAANHELLDADRLYVRTIPGDDIYVIYEVADHRQATPLDRARLESLVDSPISETTEILHVTGTNTTARRIPASPPGFIALIDGSERALRALAPARALASWYGRPLTVQAVTAGPDDLDTINGVTLQLEDQLRDDDVHYVQKSELDRQLFELMDQGHVLVASAFGVWARDGRLHGALRGLVAHDAPAVIGVGPNVPADWEPTITRPIVVCVDNSDHAHELVERLDPFVTPPRARLIVVHVADSATGPGASTTAGQVAAALNQRCGVPVIATVVDGTTPASALVEFATSVDAQLLVMNSWHHPEPGEPVEARTSTTSVASAPCPVVILSAP